jgi:hypothetical protein
LKLAVTVAKAQQISLWLKAGPRSLAALKIQDQAMSIA